MNKDIKLFNEKNSYLKSIYDEVDSFTFYRDIFPEGSFQLKGNYEESKGNGIAVIINNDKYKRVTVTDELEQIEELKNNNFVIFNGISYFGKERTLNNATLLHALVFDIDGVSRMGLLTNMLHHFDSDISPRPTYVVNSGHGVHLYYVFDKPIPIYNHLKEPLKKLKYALTDRLWNMYVSDIKEVQHQGINQGFRMVGSPTKFGKKYRLKAFKTGEKISLDYLNSFVVNKDLKIETLEYESTMTLAEAKEKYPEWYNTKILKKRPSKKWIVNRALYDWWIEKIKEGATYGHRYFCIMALSIYAVKCDIPFEELEKDAFDLLPFLNSINQEDPFTAYDIESALNSYDDEKSYATFPREDISRLTAISIPENKRNYRKQSQHIKIMNAIRDTIYTNGEWRNLEGRPKGSGTKEMQIKEWRLNNPSGTKAECNRATGLDPKTIRKWW